MLDQHQLREKVAHEIGVRVAEVAMMEGRLAGSDASLNATQSTDEDGRAWIDALEDDGPQASDRVRFLMVHTKEALFLEIGFRMQRPIRYLKQPRSNQAI